MSDARHESAPAAGCLFRLFWLAGGPTLMVLCSLAISRREPLALSWLDLLYPLIAVAVVAARNVDAKRFAGLTADGAPTTANDVRSWALKVAALGLVGWLAGHGLAWVSGP